MGGNWEEEGHRYCPFFPNHALIFLRAFYNHILPYMGYIGMCRCEGYGFQAVYFGIGYINQRVWV